MHVIKDALYTVDETAAGVASEDIEEPLQTNKIQRKAKQRPNSRQTKALKSPEYSGNILAGRTGGP